MNPVTWDFMPAIFYLYKKNAGTIPMLLGFDVGLPYN